MGIHKALGKFNSDILDIDQDFDQSTINEVDAEGNTILHRALSHPKCTSDIITLLLMSGAKVKLLNNEGNSPLVIAAQHGCSIEVLKILLQAGAKVNQVGSDGRSPLCTVLHHPNCDSDIVRLVLSAGASAKACSVHPNAFHCFMESPSKTQASVLRMILIKVIGVRGFTTQAMCLILSYPTCHSDILNILLQMGSRFNLCLMHKSSFHCYLDESVYNPNGTKNLKVDVLKLLADNASYSRGKSPLCRVLRHSQCTAVAVKLLLGYGPLLTTCDEHQSPLHCYLDKPGDTEKADLQPDVLKALLDTGLDVSLPNQNGRTPLFMALHYFNCTSEIIKILLDASASISNCYAHISLLYCYVGSNNVEIEGMKMILSRCTNINVMNHCGDKPLHCALRYSKYQVGALKLLIDHPDIDIHSKGRRGASYLHCALQNPFCKIEIVEILLNKGARINAVNDKHFTPLHTAVSNPDCGLGIIELLIDRGSSLQYHGTVTPLEIALRENRNPDLVRLLLYAGAPIVFGLGQRSMLELAFNIFDHLQYEDSKQCFIMVLKFAILKCHTIGIVRLIDRRPMRQWIRSFRIDLSLLMQRSADEVQIMREKFLAADYTLYDFVSSVRGEEEEAKFNIGDLLSVLAEENLTVYLDLISMKVDSAQLRNKLSMLQVHTLGANNKKLFLNSDVLLHLSGFLSAKDLLSYVCAYYNVSH